MEPTRSRPQLAVARSQEGGAEIIELEGELDLGSIGELDTAVDAASAARVICVDLSGLAFIDSTGLAGIVRAHQRMAQAGGRFVIVAPPGTVVRRTLETSGLLALLRVVDDRAAALGGTA